MKKNLILFVCLYFTSLIMAQDIIYKVSAELEGQLTQVDSIVVENIDNGSKLLIDSLPNEQSYEINLTQINKSSSTGISNVSKPIGLILAKNTFGVMGIANNGTKTLEFSIHVYNIKGQLVFNTHALNASVGEMVELYLPSNEVYIIRAYTSEGSQAFKSRGSDYVKQFSISRHNNQKAYASLKSAKVTPKGNFSFNIGDSIRVSIFKNGYFCFPKTKNLNLSADLNFVLKLSLAPYTNISDAYVSFPNESIIKDYNPNTGEVIIHNHDSSFHLQYGNLITIDLDSIGYLRKVIQVINEDSTYFVQTAPANLSDVFYGKQVKLNTQLIAPSIGLKSTSTAQSISKALTDEDGYIHPVKIFYHDEKGKVLAKSLALESSSKNTYNLFNDDYDLTQDLYNENDVRFSIDKGHLLFKGDAIISISFSHRNEIDDETKIKKGSVNNFECYLKTEYELSSDIKFEAKAAYSISKTKPFFKPKSATAKFFVGIVPVWITFDTQFYGKFNLNAKTKLEADYSFKQNMVTEAGISYNGRTDQFSPRQGVSITEEYSPLTIQGEFNMDTRLEIYPRVDIKFYSVLGPTIELVPFATGEIKSKAISEISGEGVNNFVAWQSKLNIGMDLRNSLKLTFLGKKKSWGPEVYNIADKNVWSAPKSIDLLGNLPFTAKEGDRLNLLFEVKDNLDNPIAGCPVYISGIGDFKDQISLTGLNGKASVEWIIPPNASVEAKKTEFSAKIFDVNQNVIDEAKDYLISNGDSLEIYKKAVLGHWIRKSTTSEIQLIYDVFYEDNGNGTYSQEADAWENVLGGRKWFDVHWSIYKRDGRYYLGTGLFLWGIRPTDPLTYPPTFVKEYEMNSTSLIQTYTKQ